MAEFQAESLPFSTTDVIKSIQKLTYIKNRSLTGVFVVSFVENTKLTLFHRLERNSSG